MNAFQTPSQSFDDQFFLKLIPSTHSSPFLNTSFDTVFNAEPNSGFLCQRLRVAKSLKLSSLKLSNEAK